MIGRNAAKAALAAAVDTQATEDLVHDDPRFAKAWSVARLVPGSFGELNAAAMFIILRELKVRRVVEIGSYLGRSTVFFARTLQLIAPGSAEVVAIDPHTGDRQQMQGLGTTTIPSLDLFRTHIAASGVGGIVRPIVKRSAEAAIGWTAPIDLLYVDGWHSYEAVMQDGRDWLPHLSSNGAVFFDDYARYEEVHRAVADLVAEGQLNLWCNSFGQALGGRDKAPVTAARLFEVARSPLARRLHRLRVQ